TTAAFPFATNWWRLDQHRTARSLRSSGDVERIQVLCKGVAACRLHTPRENEHGVGGGVDHRRGRDSDDRRQVVAFLHQRPRDRGEPWVKKAAVPQGLAGVI